MSARSEVLAHLKAFTDCSINLFGALETLTRSDKSIESPENIMDSILTTDSALQASVLRRKYTFVFNFNFLSF